MPMRFGRKAKLRRLLRQADTARDASRWREAADAYRGALAIDPANAPIQIQLGHVLKETGDRAGAERAYRAATEVRPDQADGWFQLGALLRGDGRVGEAIVAFAGALRADPACGLARDALIGLGARNAVPDAARYPPAERGEFDRLLATMRSLTRQADAITQAAIYPTRSFDAFRRAFPVSPPPVDAGTPDGGTILVRIDARAAMPVQVRQTLESLTDQSYRRWQAIVVGSEELAAHPVAGAAIQDARIRFDVEASAPEGPPTVLIAAGTALDPQALAWFGFVAERTGCAVAYADHDHAVEEWHAPRRYADPVFQPAFDPDWFGSGLSSPAAVYLAGGGEFIGDGDFGTLLVQLAASGRRIVHIPRLLATILALPEEARLAPSDPAKEHGAPAASAMAKAWASPSPKRLAVIVPTRDQPDLLERCVATLLARSAGGAPAEVIIVDNRSTQPATKTLLERWQREGRAQVLAMDEPFSWSRANNLAAGATDADNLLFLNNDTEMLTDGWSDRLDAWLARADVGIVGARLLYLDRSVQHAGFVFGLDGPPRHEAVGVPADAPGPDGRWLRPRSLAAVTGAFMAMRREVWKAVGGFEERALPIGFNDVDMCLRVRAAGLRVVYAPELQLIHHESRTRGLNVTRSQVAWDRAELRALHRRWGRALFDDPGFNPHWARHGQIFDGYREPPLREILRHIDLGARTAPWLPDTAE